MKIGITGGIGSGKSYVCRQLLDKGYPVYSCDDEAKRLMQESQEIRQQLTELIGNQAYTEGKLNRTAIAQYLFQNKNNAERINHIVHPAVRKDMEEWYKHQRPTLCFVESAILFEAGFDSAVDVTVMVYADDEVRLQRAMKRDNADSGTIQRRMAQQLPQQEVCRRADYTLHNNPTDDIDVEINKMIKNLKSLTLKPLNRKQ